VFGQPVNLVLRRPLIVSLVPKIMQTPFDKCSPCIQTCKYLMAPCMRNSMLPQATLIGHFEGNSNLSATPALGLMLDTASRLPLMVTR
jgi:hypothetical protein